jgi:hypothetical protein
MISWNVVAFTGHWVGSYIGPDEIFNDSGYLLKTILKPLSPIKLTYYLTKFDHLLAVPALIFFYLGLRTLHKSIEKKDRVQDQ